jgi:acetyl-CoA C-acetyltransferase
MEERPVIVGIGQVANRDDEVLHSPLDLMAQAETRALLDAGGLPRTAVDAVMVLPASVGRDVSGDPDHLASRLGLPPGHRATGTFSGSSPVELLARAGELVTSGRATAVLVCGGIADASVRRARARGVEPPAGPAAPWSQGSRAARPITSDTGMPAVFPEVAAGLAAPVTIFSLIESVCAASAGRSFAEQRTFLGGVLAPFTEVAARRPELAWFPVARSAEDISSVSPTNRIIDEPYTKRMTSFPTVDQAAAFLVTSASAADRFGVPASQRVHPWSVAYVAEGTPPSTRRRMDRSAALTAAVERAFALAGRTPDDVARFDLYSCFPAAVQLGAAALGIELDDPRGLTVTGGLPAFGGPGAAYAVHSIACMVEECRADPGSLGTVVGLGGMAGNMAVALLGTEPGPRPWACNFGDDVTARLVADAAPADLAREGEAVVVAMTTSVDRDGVVTGAPLIAEFADGTRTGARPVSDRLAADLAGISLVGSKVRISSVADRPVYEPF